MSSFYNSNLLDNYDSSLIPPEKDIEKPEDVEKNESNGEANKAVENLENPLRKVQYPYKTIIQCSQFLIFFAAGILVFYGLCKMRRDERIDNKGNIIPEKFLDPCNATNVVSLDEVKKIKIKSDAINDEKHSINVVVGYNLSMSPSASEYLSQKLASLTQDANNLNQQLEEQKEIRFICYKENLKKRYEDKSYREMYNKFANGIHAYIIAATILILNSFYYISKARKHELSDEQKKVCDHAVTISLTIIFYHVLLLGWLIVSSYYFTNCNIENDFKQFTL